MEFNQHGSVFARAKPNKEKINQDCVAGEKIN